MIRKLRIKFVCVIMAIVMLKLAVILGVVIHFTGQNMQMQKPDLSGRYCDILLHGSP